jgi:uncharacterized membrane protein
LDKTGLVVLTTLAPISELRGGIPLGLYFGLDPTTTFLLAVVSNSLIFFPVYFAMQLFYKKFFSKISVLNEYLKKLRERGKPYVNKYGALGVMIFVALPLPLTGAWTGTLLAWLLGMNWKKSFVVVSLGVLIAGVIVLLASLGFFKLIF